MASGTSLAYRVVIEGLPIEFVSDVAMEAGSSGDGRSRLACTRIFVEGGLTVGESVDPARAELETESLTLSLVDLDRTTDSVDRDVLTYYLTLQPTTTTYLTGAIESRSAVSFDVLDGSNLSMGDVIHIGTEAMLINGVSTNTVTVLATGRGYWDTEAVHHFIEGDEETRYPLVSLSQPTTIEGRRAFVYEYEDGDSLTGDGTLVWRGVCETDAELQADGCTWNISISGIGDVFKGDIGSDDAPVKPRGIYYPELPTAGMRWTVLESSDANPRNTDGGGGAVTVAAKELSSTFFENQEDFVEALNAAFLAKSWDTALTWDNPRFVSDGESGYHLEYTTDATTAKSFSVDCNFRLLEGRLAATFAAGTDTYQTSNLSTSTSYRVFGDGRFGDEPGARTVPRGVFGIQEGSEDRTGELDPASPFRFYTADDRDLSNVTGMVVEFFDNNPGEQAYASVTFNAANRYLQANVTDIGGIDIAGPLTPIHLYNAVTSPNIVPARSYGVGTLRRFFRRIMEISPEEANLGVMPLVTSGTGSTVPRGDVNLSDLSSELLLVEGDDFGSTAGGVDFRRRRSYVLSGAHDLMDVLKHEMRLYGVFPAIDSNGRWTVRRLVQSTDQEAADFVISEADLVGFPTWQRNGLGSINVVEFKTGYNYQEDTHKGPRVVVRDVAAISARKASKALEIAPLSRSVGTLLSVPEALRICQPVLSYYGRPYSVYNVTVKRELADGTSWRNMTLGSVCRVSAPWLPDTRTGKRGITAKGAIVIGRSYILGGATVELTLLSSDIRLFGYSPSVYCVGDNVTDTAHTLTVSFSDPYESLPTADTSQSLSDFFVAGDQIDILEWDNSSPTVRPGEVTTVTDPSTLVITLDASANLSSGTDYVIRYSDATDASTSSTQDDYAYLAGDDGVIDFSSAQAARRYV